VSSTDHPVLGPDEADGEEDPAAAPSRARVAGYGWMPWAAGAGLAVTQLAVVVFAPGDWRAVGGALLAVVTLAGLGFAVFGGGGSR
jgi:hypothetical protein